MKKLLAMSLCILLLLGACFALFSCNGQEEEEQTTASPGDTTNAEESTTVIDSSETTTANPDESGTTEDGTTGEGNAELPALKPQEGDVVIESAEDFINFNKAVIASMRAYADATTDQEIDSVQTWEDITVYFENDVDMSGYEWIPMDGHFLTNITFDGRGHTIKNLKIIDPEDERIPDLPNERDSGKTYKFGFGLVGNAYSDMTFKDLKFETVELTAYAQHCGVLIGGVYAGDGASSTIYVDNVSMEEVTINGYMPSDDSGHNISIRVACFIGMTTASTDVEFTDCSVTTAYLSGYHNLAAFLGYDGSATVSEYNFTNCSAFDITMEFSYCQADAYTLKKPFAFVSVFFNSAQWIDNIDAVESEGNTYGAIVFKDYLTKQTFSPANFRSWSESDEAFINWLDNNQKFSSVPEIRK